MTDRASELLFDLRHYLAAHLSPEEIGTALAIVRKMVRLEGALTLRETIEALVNDVKSQNPDAPPEVLAKFDTLLSAADAYVRACE